MCAVRTQEGEVAAPAQVGEPVGRVAHSIMRYVERSETFIPDGIRELERLGWDPWIVCTHVVNREFFPYPAAERIRVATRPRLPRLVANRVLMRNLPGRQASWLQPAFAAIAPDVVHAHFGHGAAAASPAARRLDLPLVATLHGTDVTAWPQQEPWARRGYRWLFRDAACLIVPSEFLAGKLRALGYEGRLEIVPAGVPFDRIAFTGPRLVPDPQETRLLLIARQVPVKGTDVLLRALPRVVERHPRVVLDVVGYGPDVGANGRLARQLGVGERVRFRGGRPHDETLELVRAADVVVVPSRRAPNGDEESSCVVAREALATGVPLVATRSGGIPENLPPELRDELVPQADAEALAQRICEILETRDGWMQRARVGRRWMEEHFHPRRLAERIAAVYEDVRRR